MLDHKYKYWTINIGPSLHAEPRSGEKNWRSDIQQIHRSQFAFERSRFRSLLTSERFQMDLTHQCRTTPKCLLSRTELLKWTISESPIHRLPHVEILLNKNKSFRTFVGVVILKINVISAVEDQREIQNRSISHYGVQI